VPVRGGWHRVLGMMPSLRKSATLAQTDTWRKDRRLRLHHACIAHVVEMVNQFCNEDKYILYADGKVSHCLYQHILRYTIIY
jgi:molybdenum cofactor biosynthesis enzyme MoaA